VFAHHCSLAPTFQPIEANERIATFVYKRRRRLGKGGDRGKGMKRKEGQEGKVFNRPSREKAVQTRLLGCGSKEKSLVWKKRNAAELLNVLVVFYFML
jgi:hypothetical protein